MSNIIPFNPNTLPANLTEAFSMFADINKDVVRVPSFPSLSIKGKVFTLSKDGVKTILKRPGPDGDEEVAQSVGVVILRANMNAKTFYAKRYAEGDSEGARPDCYSFDGVVPSANSPHPQANKCAICPHNQWGSRAGDGDKEESKGKACNDNARLAIATPDNLSSPMLLRVPPASLKPLRESVKELNARKVPYNVVVTRVSFDPTAPSPRLLFKPAGLLPQDTFGVLKEMYENEQVRAIVGADDPGLEHVVPYVPENDEDQHYGAHVKAAAASRAAIEAVQAKAAKTPPPAVVAAVEQAFAPEPVAVAAPTPAPVAEKPKKSEPKKAEPVAKAAAPSAGSVASLLGDMDSLLANFDD